MSERKPALVERSYDSWQTPDGVWHRRERRRVWYDDDTKGEWETPRDDSEDPEVNTAAVSPMPLSVVPSLSFCADARRRKRRQT